MTWLKYADALAESFEKKTLTVDGRMPIELIMCYCLFMSCFTV